MCKLDNLTAEVYSLEHIRTPMEPLPCMEVWKRTPTHWVATQSTNWLTNSTLTLMAECVTMDSEW